MKKPKRIFWELTAVFFTLSCCLGLCGCYAIPTVDDAGNQATVYKLTPATEAGLDKAAIVAEGAGGALTAMDIVVPGTGALGGALIAAAGVWRRLKPQLQEAQQGKAIGYKAGEATAKAIDDFKTANPEAWTALKPYLKDEHGQAIENFYRALRGIDPKV